ncbi:hypothetical protein RCH21_003404 [Arthrobacter sp. PL16]|nr:hypothetical protein [Arthrobacter sp. PL16]
MSDSSEWQARADEENRINRAAERAWREMFPEEVGDKPQGWPDHD